MNQHRLTGLLIVLFAVATAPHGHAEFMNTYLPQIGDGGGWTTQINITATKGAGGVVTFFDSRAARLTLDFCVIEDDVEREETASGVQFQLTAGQTLIVKTKGNSDPFVDGYAVIAYESEGEPAINGLFQYSPDGILQAEAGVAAAAMAGTQVLPVDLDASLSIGIAVVGEQELNELRFLLFNGGGTLVAAVNKTLRKHDALFLRQLFPELGADFQGSLMIRGNRVVKDNVTGDLAAATALRLASNFFHASSLPLRYPPPGRPPELEVLQSGNGPRIRISVAANSVEQIDQTSLEIQIKLASGTMVLDSSGADLWLSVRMDGKEGEYRFLAPKIGGYEFRARAWNLNLPGPFTDRALIDVAEIQ